MGRLVACDVRRNVEVDRSGISQLEQKVTCRVREITKRQRRIKVKGCGGTLKRGTNGMVRREGYGWQQRVRE